MLIIFTLTIFATLKVLHIFVLLKPKIKCHGNLS